MAKAPTAAIRKDLTPAAAPGRRPAGRRTRRSRRSPPPSSPPSSASAATIPLLGKGDINLYSLFVERALRLGQARRHRRAPDPLRHLRDKTASEFFRSISTTGRLAGIYDFENRRSANPDAGTAKWFPDVDSRFKFCAMIMGGAARRLLRSPLRFLPDGRDDLQNDDRGLPPHPRRLRPASTPTQRPPQRYAADMTQCL